MIKPNLLFYRDWSEVSPKGTHMYILSLFASDLKKGKYFQANVCISAALHWTVTFISNYSAKGLSITWSLLPHVYKWMLAASCWVTVNWSTALPHGAGRVTVATAPAVAAARAKPIKCRHSAWSITVWGNREDGSSAEEELVGLHQKTASGLTSQAAGNLQNSKSSCWCLNHSSAITNTREVLRQAFAAMLSPSTVLSTLQSQTDCDSVTQVVLCFLAGKACS